MPNWCANALKITAQNEESRAMLQKIYDEIDRVQGTRVDPNLLQTIMPCPQELKETMSGYYGDEEKQKELEKKQQENVEKYGHANWYDYCVDVWGTKWDVSGVSILSRTDNTLSLTFDTAWSPPIGVYNELTDKGFFVEATYVEAGMGYDGFYFAGNDETGSIDYSYPMDADEEFEEPNLEEYFQKKYGTELAPAHFGG